MIQATTRRSPVPASAAIAFIGGASVLRIAVSGPLVAASLLGALMFSAVLLVAVWAVHTAPVAVKPASLGVGAVGGIALIAMPLLHSSMPLRVAQPTSTLLIWSLVVTVVACAEEFAVRGILFNALQTAHGTVVAIATTSVVFAMMHVPLYGWRALPLDLAVGVWLGVLRHYAGVTASATAHTLADLATGWLL